MHPIAKEKYLALESDPDNKSNIMSTDISSMEKKQETYRTSTVMRKINKANLAQQPSHQNQKEDGHDYQLQIIVCLPHKRLQPCVQQQERKTDK